MDTAFVIGNGESRPIFPIQDLKSKGIIYGCNAIYRDNPELCDHIVAVNQPMYDELKAWHDQNKAIMNIPVDQLVGKENHMKKLVDPKSIAKVNDIVKALQDKQTMPPIHVRRLKNGYQILDGHHRFWGHRKAGANSIKAKIFNHFHRIRSISIYHMEPCTFSDPVKSLVYTAIVCNALLLLIPGLASILLDVFPSDLVSPVVVKFVMDVLAVNSG